MNLKRALLFVIIAILISPYQNCTNSGLKASRDFPSLASNPIDTNLLTTSSERINVKQFGAIGDAAMLINYETGAQSVSGTDSTKAIQTAIDYAIQHRKRKPGTIAPSSSGYGRKWR